MTYEASNAYTLNMQPKLPTVNVKSINHLEAGKRIRALREKAGMSVRRLANEMGFSAPFMSDLERGRRNWTEAHFNKAVDILSK